MTDGQITVRGLGRATLARQLLLERGTIPPVEAVAALVGLQAQEAKPPPIGLWSRLDGFERSGVLDPLRDRALVRAPFLRGTLHVTTAADYLTFRPVLQPVFAAGLKMLGDRAAGLDVPAVVAEAERILNSEGPLTFTNVRDRLQAIFPDVNERALGFAVRMHLPVVMTPTSDAWGFPSDAAFRTASSWLGAPVPVEAADLEALRELLRRYLAAFGPATAADAQTWSGLQKLAPVLRGMREELLVLRDERGRELYDLPDAPRPDPEIPAPLRFLPEFDNLVLGHADRARVTPETYRGRIVTKNLRVRATVLWDGQAVATWRWTAAKRGATLTVEPFEPLPRAAVRAIGAEGEQLLRFVEPEAAAHAVVVADPL
jgi:hypothetical protein